MLNLLQKNLFFKFIIIIIIVSLTLYSLFKDIYRTNHIKVCLCTLGKNENRYIKEYVEHYKKYGVDKIFIYDNNEIDGEKFEDVILNYIEDGFVEIKNWRGIEKAQFRIMNDCYSTNYNKYNWLIFYDIDEFIYLKYYKNVKLYLSKSKFDKCGKVELNWVHRVDDGKSLYYDNRSLSERFIYKESNILKKNFHPQIKSIIRGVDNNIRIGCLHKLTSQLSSCDGFGRNSNTYQIYNLDPDYKINYINHYYGKSLEEFAEKIMRGSAAIGKTNISLIAKINRYFQIYNIDKMKIDFLEKKTGLNLSNFRKNIIFK